MISETAISIGNLGKCYQIYENPRDRLLQMLVRGRRQYYREFWALRDVSFTVRRGEVFGIVGRNGAGKSTLLQLICGTLNPTHGDISVHGRVAALLELGAGFNPEFSGRENVYLNASVLGLTRDEIDARYDEIVAFSGIGDFIDQPVKTYSSGMYVRLAFSVATSVEPDILVVDEALSVGDGDFSRKSFDRIMALKNRGATILFCSHSMYQVEAFCERALWLEKGGIRMLDAAPRVTAAYQATLAAPQQAQHDKRSIELQPQTMGGRILKVYGTADGVTGTVLQVTSLQSDLSVTIEFVIGAGLPVPSVALGIDNASGVSIASAGSANSGVQLQVDASGRGSATVRFPKLPLLKGEYSISAILCCEKALHAYDIAQHCMTLQVSQTDLAQGVVVLPHEWLQG